MWLRHEKPKHQACLILVMYTRIMYVLSTRESNSPESFIGWILSSSPPLRQEEEKSNLPIKTSGAIVCLGCSSEENSLQHGLRGTGEEALLPDL